MDNVNPYAAPNGVAARTAYAPYPPTSLVTSLRRGAWLGWKWGNYIAAAYAGLTVMFVSASTLWMHARGKRVRFPADNDPLFILLIAIGFYLETCIYGGIIGAVIAARNYYRLRRRQAINDQPRREESLCEATSPYPCSNDSRPAYSASGLRS